MSVLRMTLAIYEAIRAHGEQTYPHECCGALLGTSTPEGWLVQAALPAQNTHAGSGHNRYNIAAAELVKIEREGRRQGLCIAGFYHSHPDQPALWSAIDLAEAHWLGCCFVITSIAQGKATVTNSFLLVGSTEEGKRFEQEAIRVDHRTIDADCD